MANRRGKSRSSDTFIFLGSKITVDADCSHEIKRCLLLGRRAMANLNSVLGFPGGSAGKEFACNAGDLGSIAGLWRSPGEGDSYPLQYSGLENSMDCIVHGVAKSQTRLRDTSISLHFKQRIKKQRHLFADKGPYSWNYGFSNSHVQMWELDHKEG